MSRKVADVQLRVPVSQARIRAILRLTRTAPEYAAGAAWGICSHGPGRTKAQWSAADPAGFGEAVIDDLLNRKASYDEILEAGYRALMLIAEALPSEQEVEDAAKNSEAPPEP